VPRAIAKVRERAAQRHGQHAAKAEAAAVVREEQLGQALVERVERLQTIIDSIIEKAMAVTPAAEGRPECRPDYLLTLKAVAEARRNLELIGRLTGTLEPGENKGVPLITFESFEVLYKRVRLGKA
jgi:hypothetical protein